MYIPPIEIAVYDTVWLLAYADVIAVRVGAEGTHIPLHGQYYTSS